MSNANQETEKIVVVTGDVTIDWNIACAIPDRRSGASWIEERSHTRAYWQRGGAALLADLVDAIAARLPQSGRGRFSVRQTAAPVDQAVPEDPRFHHTYKQWRIFPARTRSVSAGQPGVWRLDEWLGMSLSTADLPSPQREPRAASVVDDTADAALIVLGDAALGFRDQPALWPQALQAESLAQSSQPHPNPPQIGEGTVTTPPPNWGRSGGGEPPHPNPPQIGEGTVTTPPLIWGRLGGGEPPHPNPPQIGEGTVTTPPLIWGRLGGGEQLRRPWILLKMSRPVAHGPLWEHLHRHFAERLIVVTTIDDLRQTEVQISRELSWERTAQDLAWELVYNPRINTLSRCAHLIVSFGAAGAMLLSRLPAAQTAAGTSAATDTVTSHLFFDPKVIEGMWEEEHPGGMSGDTSCITASLAHQLLVDDENPDIHQAVQGGLAALRRLHQEGYGSQSGSADRESPVVFPIPSIVDELFAVPQPFSVTPVRDPARSILPSAPGGLADAGGRLWTILEDRYTGSLDQVAQQIVLQGAEIALQDVPLGRFGSLLTVDRREIESYRSLRTLVGEYCRQVNPARPLSIAVFGAPGSGKSFGVAQIAASLLPGQIEKLTFNLSQFDAPRQLLDAFHRVRDTALTGHIPLVFWDEFDTALDRQPLGWLRHFLAPMQDGVFQEGQIVHPIGRAIFVFAGGTCERMATFDRGADDAPFRAAKGPDFVSRLKGFVDVAGPNPQAGNAEADRYFIIRRAILLRFVLQSHAPHIFHRRNGVSVPQIDSGLLRAFLEIPIYKHGARSLESVVTSSSLAGKSQFERSSLPTEAQLHIHVDGRQFLSLVQRLELDGALLERLAEAAHEIYRAGVQAQPQRDATAIPPYSDLPEAVKEQNRLAVRDIPAKLAYAGYVMRPARSDEPRFDFPAADRDELAEREHVRWLKARLAAGWRYGAQTDGGAKSHADLLPWRALSGAELALHYTPHEAAALGAGELPESEKEKNRKLIDGIPRILAQAGYTLVKVREDTARG